MHHFPLSAAIRHLRHLDAWLPSYGREQQARLQTFVSGKARLKIAMKIPHIFRIIITTVYLSCDYVIKFLRFGAMATLARTKGASSRLSKARRSARRLQKVGRRYPFILNKHYINRSVAAF